MKIEKLKVNAFGNLQDKEIEFSENINVVQGNNESGKSTLLKFITNILYGTSKTKKGREYSDYDRYKPWSTEEFSGKLLYKLDDGKKYEIYREFDKKNPKIYDENLEDISKEFTIDKTNGNQFFVEQTGLDEATFLSTLVSMQQEVKIENTMQNALLQKVANLVGTGDDNISYKKAVDKINKKQVEEIGTSRTQGRPINIVKEEMFKAQDEIGELESYKIRKDEIVEEKNEKEKELRQIEKLLKVVKELKEIEQQEKLEHEKIGINTELKEKQEKRKLELEEEKTRIVSENSNNDAKVEKNGKHTNKVNTKPRNIGIGLIIIGLILAIVGVIIKQQIVMLVAGIELVISLVCILIMTRKIKLEETKNRKEEELRNIKNNELHSRLESINAEINVLDKNIKEVENLIKEKQTNITQKTELERNRILNNLEDKDVIDKLNLLSGNNNYETIQNEKEKINLKIRSLELEEDSIEPKLERSALLEEHLEELKQRKEELEKENAAIEYAKEVLEKADKKMKQNVTPKLTESLSKNISKISNGKYTRISLHEEKGIIIENDKGEYIEANKLSVGTIDQLYLSLRLAISLELTKESMPIILDEAFAYYDEERLENILKYVSEEFKDNQIIIFTCTNRERQILDKLGINYNSIKI